MHRIVASTGTVSHIPASSHGGDGNLVVTTACGKSFDESTVTTDDVDEFDHCKACDKKLEAAVEDSDNTELPE